MEIGEVATDARECVEAPFVDRLANFSSLQFIFIYFLDNSNYF